MQQWHPSQVCRNLSGVWNIACDEWMNIWSKAGRAIFHPIFHDGGQLFIILWACTTIPPFQKCRCSNETISSSFSFETPKDNLLAAIGLINHCWCRAESPPAVIRGKPHTRMASRSFISVTNAVIIIGHITVGYMLLSGSLWNSKL